MNEIPKRKIRHRPKGRKYALIMAALLAEEILDFLRRTSLSWRNCCSVEYWTRLEFHPNSHSFKWLTMVICLNVLYSSDIEKEEFVSDFVRDELNEFRKDTGLDLLVEITYTKIYTEKKEMQ